MNIVFQPPKRHTRTTNHYYCYWTCHGWLNNFCVFTCVINLDKIHANLRMLEHKTSSGWYQKIATATTIQWNDSKHFRTKKKKMEKQIKSTAELWLQLELCTNKRIRNAPYNWQQPQQKKNQCKEKKKWEIFFCVDGGQQHHRHS